MAKRPTPADALRHAVDQSFQAAADQALTTRDRAQELVDDLAQTAGRLRGALEELRPTTGDDVRSLSVSIQALDARVRVLEQAMMSEAPPTGSPTPSRGPGRPGPRAGRSARPPAGRSSKKPSGPKGRGRQGRGRPGAA